MTSPTLSPEQASGFIESVIDPAGWALKQLERQSKGHWTYAFYPNECSRYHAPVTFKSEQCPVCRAHRLCNRLENRLDRALETIGTLESEIADLRDGVDRV